MCRSYPAPAPRDIGLGDLTAARCDNRRAAKAGADSDDLDGKCRVPETEIGSRARVRASVTFDAFDAFDVAV